MRTLWKGLHGIASCVNRARSLPYESSRVLCSNPSSGLSTKCLRCPTSDLQHNESGFLTCTVLPGLERRLIISNMAIRHLTTVGLHEKPANEDTSAASDTVEPQRIKFKRPDKTARHIMNILDKEEVEKMKASKDIPDIKPGYIVQLKVEVPENKRRVSILKGIVIARRNAGLHTTFRLRRMVAGVGVESVFPLYSPNIKEMKVLDKKEVRRAKLYYLRDRMNALKQK